MDHKLVLMEILFILVHNVFYKLRLNYYISKYGMAPYRWHLDFVDMLKCLRLYRCKSCLLCWKNVTLLPCKFGI